MELDELKKIWAAENKKLESRIALNESLIRKMNFDKAISEAEKLFRLSLLGRRLALTYALLSFIAVSRLGVQFAYSIPAFMGTIAMVCSFISHLAIKKPDYENDSVVELQKAICKFRIHSATHAQFDTWIVIGWLIVMIPASLAILGVFVYAKPAYFTIFILAGFLVTFTIITVSKKAYRDYDQKLKASEAQLEKIAEFEKVSTE